MVPKQNWFDLIPMRERIFEDLGRTEIRIRSWFFTLLGGKRRSWPLTVLWKDSLGYQVKVTEEIEGKYTKSYRNERKEWDIFSLKKKTTKTLRTSIDSYRKREITLSKRGLISEKDMQT